MEEPVAHPETRHGAATPAHLAFGAFRLDPDERVLLRADQAVPLTPKALDTLLALVERHGHLVAKKELIRTVWPDAFVEENNLTQNISILRKLLGEDADGGKFIETVPKRGYRFVAKVAEVPAASREAESARASSIAGIAASKSGDAALPGVLGVKTIRRRDYAFSTPVREVLGKPSDLPVERQARWQIVREEEEEETETAATPTRAERAVVGPSGLPRPMARRPFQLRRGLLIGVPAVALVGAVVLRVHRMTRESTADRFARPRTERLTNVGRATAVAISPRGDYIAYALGEPGQQELCIKHLPTASTASIVARDAVLYWSLTFSPDGHYVYYAVWRHNETSGVLYRVPLLGGTPQRLIHGSGTSVSFSPDGRRFAYTVGYSRGESHLMIAEADGTAPRALLTRRHPYLFSEGGGPAWSPDGTLIACGARTLGGQRNEQRLITVRVADAGQHTISERGWTAIGRVVWLPEGSGLLMTAKEDHFSPWRIWHVSYPSGVARLVVDDPNEYKSLTLPADGSGFVAVRREMVSGNWVWPAGRPDLARRISSEVGDYPFTGGLSWTPDGKLLRRSRAGGNWDIWMMNADGTGLRQLTFDPHTDLHPSVFADGHSVALASNRAGRLSIWRIWMDGGDAKRLTDGDDEVRPQASPDGAWVVYQRRFADGRPTIWKVPAEGGQAVQLSERHSLRPVISPDGRLIGYFCMAQQKWGIEVMPMEGGEPIARFDIPPTVRSRALHWTPDGRALAYVDDPDGLSNLWRLPLDGGPRRQLTSFNSDHIPSFAWSPDGKRIAAVRESETSDVVQVTFAP